MKQRHSSKHSGQEDKKSGKTAEEKRANKNEKIIESADIKNAHASGIGSFERSDESQIEKLNNREAEKDDNVY